MSKRQRLDTEATSSNESDYPVVKNSVFADAEHKARWRESAIKQAHEKAREREIDEIYERARILAEARTEGYARGLEIAKAREEGVRIIRLNALSGITNAIKLKIVEHNLLPKFFTNFQESEINTIESYIIEHPDCTIEDLAKEIGLIGACVDSS